MEEATDIPTKCRVDGITAVMLIVTVAALVGAGWLRTRHKPADPPPVAGALAPPLRLLDLQSAEPILLVGLRGKVVWVVFWSAESASRRSSLRALEPAWNWLKAQSRFAMVVAAVEADEPESVRVVVAEAGVKLPVYLASAETRRRFGATQADPPLSVLIDADGKIVALARGTSPQTIGRITDQSRRLLDELGPDDDTRFARYPMSPDDRSECVLPKRVEWMSIEVEMKKSSSMKKRSPATDRSAKRDRADTPGSAQTPSPPERSDFTMMRFGRLEDMDRSFDIEYWQRQGDAAIYRAAWEMVEAYWRDQGGDPDELRLQRTVEAFQRR